MGELRCLIVNADDFGLSPGTNRGIIQAHECGIVTSASLMVRQAAAAQAAAYARQRTQLSVGLHVDLGEWINCDGEWRPVYEVVSADDADAVAAEVERQLDCFRTLVLREPTHLDSHQHVHTHEPVRSVMLGLAQRLSLPLRQLTARVHYCGDFYGQGNGAAPFLDGISVENLIDILANLPGGVTELSCHPGLDETLDSIYRTERLVELRALCDQRVRVALDDLKIELISFSSLLEA